MINQFLSKNGRQIFFPKDGIISQSLESKSAKINATIGIALDEANFPMSLSSIQDSINLDSKDIFPYESTFGNSELRKKWRSLIYEKNSSLTSEISLPVVTAGITNAIFAAAYLFVDEDDQVIMPDMRWENYDLIFENCIKAKINEFKFYNDNNKFNLETLSKALAVDNEKIILLLNFPNNPTGYSLLNDEAHGVSDLLLKAANLGKKIVVIIDDAYFGLNYEDKIYSQSLFSLIADLHNNILAVKVDGATKEDFAWGLRVGFITFGAKKLSQDNLEDLEYKTAGVLRASISSASKLSQNLILHALDSKNYNKDKQQNFELLQKRYLKVKQILNNEKYLKYFEALPFNSGYFMCIRFKNHNAEEIRQKLLKKYSTGTIVLGDLMRIAFSAVKNDDLETLFTNIYLSCKSD